MLLNNLIQIGLPVSLALMMLSMGMVLTARDFKPVFKQPKAFLVGLSAQMIFVPLLAVLLLYFFQLPPLLAVGLFILSISPGGTTSNLFSYLARGDVALSIALTAIASIITPFSIPFLTELALNHYTGDTQSIIIPIGLTMKRLFMASLLPLALGLIWRAYQPLSANRIQPFIHRLSIVLFLSVIVSMIIQQWEVLPAFLNQVIIIISVMIMLAMLIGYYWAKLFNLKTQAIKTLTIETGMQNGGMALIVTQGVLHNADMSMVPIIYGLIMLIPILFFALISRYEIRSTV